MPTFEQIVDAVARVGVPSVALGYCLYALNGTMKEVAAELRAVRETLSAVAAAPEEVGRQITQHMTERADFIVHQVDHDVRAALGPIKRPPTP